MQHGHIGVWFLMAFLFAGCQSAIPEQVYPAHDRVVSGDWHMELDLGEAKLPFRFHMAQDADQAWMIKLFNASEVIEVSDTECRGDSFIVRMPLYDSEFRGRFHRTDRIEGVWTNYLKGPDYHIPFVATAGARDRFPGSAPATSIGGRWNSLFAIDKEQPYPALGLFEQDAHGRVTGTFLTETGDYRYLEGRATGDSLLLSSFDGAFALLFKAQLRDDTLHGSFWSGTHWKCAWKAHRDDAFELRDPDSLTRLKEGHHMVEFSFPDLEGNPTSPSDERYRGKVLLIQVMGSWCPNCVDETRLLNELYSRYHDHGLEVLSVAFEKHADSLRAIRGLERFREVLDVRYPILYAGQASKGAAAAKLPFLEHVMSFPTCIIVDHMGTVRRIRTGIYGPGTGKHYERYSKSLDQFIASLLQEAQRQEIVQR